MPQISDKVKKELTDKLTEAFAGYGLNPTMTRAYMAIFFSDKPLGLKEISEKTGYSISTVCTTVDVLERLVDIRKFKKPGSKKIYYECEHDIPSTFAKKINNGKRMIQIMTEKLKEGEEKLKKENTPEAKRMLEKLVKMREDYESCNALMDKLLEQYLQHLEK